MLRAVSDEYCSLLKFDKCTAAGKSFGECEKKRYDFKLAKIRAAKKRKKKYASENKADRIKRYGIFALLKVTAGKSDMCMERNAGRMKLNIFIFFRHSS